ncbi:MAG TPA: PEGA domain-containing protein [Terriglobales bacterium]|nr:PEGA domain-containing protein [Terriglobales bacterium]
MFTPKKSTRQPYIYVILFGLCVLLLAATALQGQNKVLGELQLQGVTSAEKDAGIWVDGQYLGYLKELKGSKKILLLPGEHDILARQAGYKDFHQKIALQPAEVKILPVALEKDNTVTMPTITAEVKLSVNPDRAAVFVDGTFVGHAGELGGMGRGLLVAPGKRKITISLTGYQTFETEVDLVANQKFQLKTDLTKTGALPESLPSSQGSMR